MDKNIEKQGFEQEISDLRVEINSKHKKLQDLHTRFYHLNEDFAKWLKENDEDSEYIDEIFKDE